MENRKWGVRIMEAKKYRRIFTIVVDSCGIGGAKDAERFGDAGTDTLGHIAETVGNLSIPNMQKLGIANLKELKNIAPVEKPMGYFTRLSEASNGKDTMTGHWEMMGLHITKPFLTFTEHGFPKELAPSNIQVNAIACGAIDTDMNAFLSEDERASLIEEIPAGRLGTPAEVGSLVQSLCSDSGYLTGQVIQLDGGWI